MKKCHYCGEVKKVRLEVYFGLYGITMRHACEDCDKAQKMIYNKIIRDNEKEEENRKRDWIKERDKILRSKK